MKSTGIIRKVDPLGRIVLPKELRQTLKINTKDPLEIFVNGEQIILRKYAPGCVICGGMDDLAPVQNKLVCRSCRETITEMR